MPNTSGTKAAKFMVEAFTTSFGTPLASGDDSYVFEVPAKEVLHRFRKLQVDFKGPPLIVRNTNATPVSVWLKLQVATPKSAAEAANQWWWYMCQNTRPYVPVFYASGIYEDAFRVTIMGKPASKILNLGDAIMQHSLQSAAQKKVFVDAVKALLKETRRVFESCNSSRNAVGGFDIARVKSKHIYLRMVENKPLGITILDYAIHTNTRSPNQYLLANMPANEALSWLMPKLSNHSKRSKSSSNSSSSTTTRKSKIHPFLLIK